MTAVQPKRRKTPFFVAGSAAAAMAAATIGPNEGRSLVAYLDPVKVVTICNGKTKGVKMGDVATPVECDAALIEEAELHYQGGVACAPNLEKYTLKAKVGFTDFIYNLGIGGFCKGSVARLINAGHQREACRYTLKYSWAGGRIFAGLLYRRERMLPFCMDGTKG